MNLYVAILLLNAPALPDAPEPAPDVKARELKIERGTLPVKKEGRLGEPTKITSKKELADAVPDKDAAASITKQVDFGKEFVVLFAWSGSGGDRLTMNQDKGVVFTLKRGLTRDLRSHSKVFALPRGTKYRMGK
jgi:hypothetical protein